MQDSNTDITDLNDIDLSKKINDIHDYLKKLLVHSGFEESLVASGEIRPHSILYMTYWFHGLRNNREEQARIEIHLKEYIGASLADIERIVEVIFSDAQLKTHAKEYVEQLLIPIKTVDLVIMKPAIVESDDKEVLCVERNYYPFGLALPGGIIRDEDETNELNILPSQYAALRIAADKVLGFTKDLRYSVEKNEAGTSYLLVRGVNEVPNIKIYAQDEGGYHYQENIKSVLRPSDPRHIVDTVAFRCEIEGEPSSVYIWRSKNSIMSTNTPTGGFAFGHHREIVAFITAQTSVEKERSMRERDFIRGLINDPLASYKTLKARFDAAGNSPDVPFPELFPVVDQMLSGMFNKSINELCTKYPVLVGFRDKAVISLRQVCLKNKTFLPYGSTIRAIAEGIAFFDLVARQKRGFYDTAVKDKIIEHDPRTTPYASYHMYRYKYRYDQMLTMIPHEIIVPTYESLSATDLLRVRGVPIRFIGLSHDFLYVDEFEQSPEEFFMHDANHSWRMIMEDSDAAEYGKTKDELIEESNLFINDYLDRIKILSSDSEQEKELKKLKKIILFEVVHEDARPFLKDVICRYIQLKEGGPVSFEVPRIDPKTSYMDIVETVDTGISTLSYVRNKLQHGFYDHIDAQQPQIVDPKFRTAHWITRAAYDMLVELEAEPNNEASLDEQGHVSYEWLLQRTCAAGPDNIHGADEVDPAVLEYGDDTQKLNPKRYQA
jgi:hypothetical protein